MNPITIRTYTGRVIDLSNLKVEEVDIRDIARGLSNCCRFAGQIPQFYSVGQHAMLVSMLVPMELALHALHHDDSEAYLGDVSRNLKHSDSMKGYRDIEAQVTSTIEFALGLPLISEQDHRTIKAADDLAAIIEHINLRHNRLFVPDDVRAAVECGFVRTSEADLMALVGRAWRGIVEDEPKQVYKDFLKRDADFRDPKLLQGALVCPKCGQKALKVDAGFLCTSESCVHCGYGNSDMGFSL